MKKLTTKTIKRGLVVSLMMMLLFAFSGCSREVGEKFSTNSGAKGTTYQALFYTNNGDLYSIVEGKEFSFTPNKIKEYGYNSSGNWESYYTTSAVLTVQIDGNYLESCGNTIILKEDCVEYVPVEDILESLESQGLNPDVDAPSLSVDNKKENDSLSTEFDSYYNLKWWWTDIKERGQGGAKMIVIQSQNGDNIGVLTGNDVTWRVSEDLPKTTVLDIDGHEVLIHRANFQIIDVALLEK